MLGKFLLALLFFQTQTNQANGVIRGQILIPSVRAAERVPVVIQRSDGPVVARVYSDVQGNYEARNLPVGTYDVIVNVEGYEEVRQQIGLGAGTFSAVTVNIPLNEKPIIIKRDTPIGDSIDVSELSRNYPRKAVQDYDKAREELRKGNEAKAIDLLAGAVKLAPDFYSAHQTLGGLYQKSNRFRDSETAYRKARELNPRVPEPLVGLGSMFIEEAAARASEGQEAVGKILDSALDALEESVKVKPTARGYYFLGTANYRSNFFPEAETNLRAALDMDPRMGAGYLMLANLYLKQRRWRRALEQLDIYLAANPNSPDRAQIEETRAKVAARIQ